MLQDTLQLAAQLHQAGELGKAEALYLQLLRQSPRDPDVLQLLSLVASQTGRHERAAEYIRQAIGITGGTPESYFHLARCSEALHRFDDAVSAYRKSLALEPVSMEALFRLSWLLGKHTETSRELLRNGLDANQAGRLVEAVDSFRQAIEAAGGAPVAAFHIARAFEALGQSDKALSSYRRTLALDPDLVEALFRLAQLLEMRADEAEDRELCECYLKLAPRFLSQDKLAAAEVCCREVLDRDENNAVALDVLAEIFRQIGLGDDVRGWLRDPPPGAAAGPRYLIIKSWGSGFWSDVSSVLGGLLLAEATNRIPVVHWGSNSLFGDDSGQDAFRRYFEPVSDIGLHDLAQLEGADYYPPKWNRTNLSQENLSKWAGAYSRLSPLYYINRKETVAVCDFYIGVADVLPWLPAQHPMRGRSAREAFHWLIRKYLTVRPHVLEQSERFYRSHLAGRPFAAIHLRGADKILEFGDQEAINEALIRRLEDVDPGWRIFLLTDDEQWLRLVRGRYGDRIISTSCRRSSGMLGVHFSAEGNERTSIGMEVMIDTVIALRADRFIGTGSSNVAGFISMMRDWAAADCIMATSPIIFKRNLLLYSCLE